MILNLFLQKVSIVGYIIRICLSIPQFHITVIRTRNEQSGIQPIRTQRDARYSVKTYNLILIKFKIIYEIYLSLCARCIIFMSEKYNLEDSLGLRTAMSDDRVPYTRYPSAPTDKQSLRNQLGEGGMINSLIFRP